MGFLKCVLNVFLFVSMLLSVHGDPLVPALCIFGDSVVDVGNNNNLQTLIKANFPPYGRDFVTHKPTGRFCNGKLATDFTADYLGFTSYPPAYLSQEAKGRNILTGVNFASAASGYYDITAQLYSSVTLTQQLSYYKEWQSKVVSLVGKAKANDIFSGGIHLISAGSSDFIQNYYINPMLNRPYSPDQFSDILLKSYDNLVQNLYELRVRRIGVTTLPPTGCLPAAITLFGSGSNRCVERLNHDAVSFNNKLNITSINLKSKFPGLKLVVFDIYNPLLELITKPTDYGIKFTKIYKSFSNSVKKCWFQISLPPVLEKFLVSNSSRFCPGFFESRKACCGTGTIETSFLCNARSVGTCKNATEYVFWDGFHPCESANEKIAQSLLEQGFDLIS